MENTLKKSLSAGNWSIIDTVMQRVFALGTLFILARLLTPGDFGIVALSILIPTFLDFLTNPPLDTAAMTRAEGLPRYLNAIWSFNIIRSGLLLAAVILAAPFIANFFHIPDAVLAIRLAGFGIFIQNFANIGQVYFSRDLDLKSLFLRNLAGKIVYTLAALALAVTYHTYWALVFANLFSITAMVLATYVLHPYRPRFTLQFQVLRELIEFSKWIFGQSIVLQFSSTVRDSLIGRFTSPTALGIFSKAQALADGPMAPILSAINKVSFISYLQVKDSKAHVAEGLSKTFDVLAFIAAPYFMIVLFSGPALVHALLGNAWLAMTPYLQLFIIEAALDALVVTLGVPVFNAIGKPRIQFINQSVRTIVLLASLIVLVPRYGIWGAVIATLLSVAVSALVVLYNLVMHVSLDFKRIATNIFVAVIAALLPLPVASYLFTMTFFNTSLGYLFTIGFCGALYMALVAIIGHYTQKGPYTTLQVVYHSIMRRAAPLAATEKS